MSHQMVSRTLDHQWKTTRRDIAAHASKEHYDACKGIAFWYDRPLGHSARGRQTGQCGENHPRATGRNVVLDKAYGSPLSTKDGVTVAKEIELKNPFENMGAQMVREAASTTSDVAGDGTTTATVLAQAIYREGHKQVTAGHNPMEIRWGMAQAVEIVVDTLQVLIAEAP